MDQDGVAYRRFARVEMNATIVSLTASEDATPISGFLRDISEGGLKIQKIAVGREVQMGRYQCRFILPGFGKIQTEAEVVGFGREEDKFSQHIVRVRFTRLDAETRDKIKKYVEQKQTSDK